MRRPSTCWSLVALVGLLATPAARAADPSPEAAGGAPLPCKLTPLTIRPGDCTWGAPLQVGVQWLLPKVCRVETPAQGDKPAQFVLRHGIDVVGTNRSIYLPATPWAAGREGALPAPGEWLAGEPPLLVLPAGLAAFDVRGNKAEWVLEADGALVAVARNGDVIGLADRIPAHDKQPAFVEFSAVDVGKGVDFGAVATKDANVTSLSIEQAGQSTKMVALLESPKGSAQATIALTADNGLPAAKDGKLPVQLSAPPAASAAAALTDSCPQFPQRNLIRPALPAVQASAAGVQVQRSWAVPTSLPAQTPQHCAALAVGASPSARFVWMWDAAKKTPLAAELTCRH